MKRHLGWVHVAATAAIVAGSSLPHAVAQYAPYRPIPQQPAQRPVAAPQQVAPAMQPMYTAYRPQGPQYRGPAAAPYGQPVGYPQTAVGYPQTAAAYPQTAMQYPQYQGYPLMAQQPSEAMPAPTPSETLPTPPQATNGVVPTNGTAVPGGTVMPNGQGMPMQDHGYVGTGGYPSTGHGDMSGYGYGHGYGNNCGYQDYGVGNYFNQPCNDTQWFGGVYWLFMNRDDGEFRRLTSQLDTPSAYPYYPTADQTVLSTDNVDHDFRSGFEVRFGSTLSNNNWYADDCDHYGYGNGCDTGCQQSCATATFAWEVGYWLLDDDVNTAQVVDDNVDDTNRMYGMKNFAGIEYNGEPVNLWYDYQVPVEDPAGTPPWGSVPARVIAQRVRSNFRAQNLELNLLRIPVCGGSSCGYGSTGCDDGNGYGVANCAPVCESPFTMVTLCGFRYLRVDDDFEYATMWATGGPGAWVPPAYTPWDGVGELYYDINVDNHLAGFQLGANMNYCVSCKCNVFWNTNFGLYNNHITSYQRVYGELGPATWVGSGEDVSVESDKDDVAFVGEMQVGGSYDFNCNWRGILAYRAVAISGVALSTDQIPEDFSNQEHVALIDSDGSLIIHGVQAGVEFRY
jgi:Putative beta barrel porin-7 (BBP7)